MYTLNKAVGVPAGAYLPWVDITATELTLAELYASYKWWWLELTPADSSDRVWLNSDDVKHLYAGTSLTIVDWLTSLGNTALPTVSISPQKPRTFATYGSGHDAGFSIAACNSSFQQTQAETSMPHGVIKPMFNAINYAAVRQNVMVSVNGYWHMTDTDGASGLLVVDAFKHARIAEQLSFGLWSFKTLGGISLHPITTPMLRAASGSAMSTRFEIELGQSLQNKTPLVVIGGYLYTPADEVISAHSDTSLSVHYAGLGFEDMFVEMQRWQDVSDLPVEVGEGGQFDVNELRTDAFITALMTRSNSFVAIIPTATTIQHLGVQWQGRHSYLSTFAPRYPLRAGYGRCLEFKAIPEHGRWALMTEYELITQQLWYSGDLGVVAPAPEPAASGPYRRRQAYQVEIGQGVILAAAPVTPPAPTPPPPPPPPAPPPPPSSLLFGFVSDETAPLVGVTVSVFDVANDELLISAITVTNGYYEFTQSFATPVYLRVSNAGVTVDTPVPHPLSGSTQVDIQVLPPAQLGEIQGVLLEDANANGVIDAQETLIQDVQVVLRPAADLNQVIDGFYTLGDGAYGFIDVPEGQYVLTCDINTEVVGMGEHQSAVFSVVGGEASIVNLAVVPTYTVSGIVWQEDAAYQATAAHDDGSGKATYLSGVTVQLREVVNGSTPGSIVQTTTTDSNGRYSFTLPNASTVGYVVYIPTPATLRGYYQSMLAPWASNFWWGDIHVGESYVTWSSTQTADSLLAVGSDVIPPGSMGGSVVFNASFKLAD